MATGLDDLTDYLLAGVALLGVQGSYSLATVFLLTFTLLPRFSLGS
jgi:hypothetical protein